MSNPLWPEYWAVQAAMEADRISHRLSTATARELTLGEAAAAVAVENHLARARAACRRPERRRRRPLVDRWRGTSVECAYLNLHAAKIFLTDVLPDAEFDASIVDVSTRLGMALDRNDPRRVEGERLLQSTVGLARRAAVKQAMETAYDASDEQHVRLRDFRNIVVLAALAITMLTGLLIFLVADNPNSIPLCFRPGVTGATVPGQVGVQQAQRVCPSGDRTQPSGGDILIVAGLGALGGALGALVAIRNLRGTSTPYSVASALAVLKVPTGALSTIIGMVLLTGGFVPGLTNLDSQRQILAYALVFGIAQQLVTRIADNRAQQILENLPSKDSQRKPAQPPVLTPMPIADVAVVEVHPPSPPEDPGGHVDVHEPDPEPVLATGAPLDHAEVEDLTAESVPLDIEESDEFPDDDGEPEVNDDEAAQTGTDKGV